MALGIDGGWLALIWSHLLFVLPYVFLTLADPYRALDERFLRSAACLGAAPARVFWRIKLPLLRRPVLIALAIGFSVSIALYLPTVFAGAGRFATLTTEAIALAAGADRRLIGVETFLQSALPLAAFAPRAGLVAAALAAGGRPAMSGAPLRLDGVWLALGPRLLVPPLTLSVAPGTVTTLMGPSGCGKSSLLASLCGMLDPAFRCGGRAWLGDRELGPLPPEQRRLGILFQDDLLFPHLTVGENISFGLPPGRARPAPGRARGRARRCRPRRLRESRPRHAVGRPAGANRPAADPGGPPRARCCWTSPSPSSTANCVIVSVTSSSTTGVAWGCRRCS